MSLLRSIRQQNHQQKKRTVIVISVVIIAIITALWLWSLSGRFSKAKTETYGGSKPFQVIGNIFSTGFKDIREENELRKNLLQDVMQEDESDNLENETQPIDSDFSQFSNAFLEQSSDEVSAENPSEFSAEENVQDETIESQSQENQGVEIIEVMEEE